LVAPRRWSPTDLARALDQPEPTAEQIAVIAAPLSPALVVAGAGSGKTETMAARVAYLVANGMVRPDQILGLTFTRKAASELAARIRIRLRRLAEAGVGPAESDDDVEGAVLQPTVSTYHGFAGHLISEFGPLVGLGRAASVLSPTAAWQLGRKVVGRWDGDLHTDRSADQVTEDVLAIAAALADHLTSAPDLEQELHGVLSRLREAPPSGRQKATTHSGLADAVRRLDDRLAVLPLVAAFDQAKRSAGAVDFADQMQLAARLVMATDRVGSAMRQRFPVVLLDEYQDTGHAQRVILRALFGDPHGRGHAVTAVGDPVQSIYGWRGASASNLPRFATDFPTDVGSPAPRLSLLTSFRNAGRVLDLANAVSRQVRGAPVAVDELRARPGAPDGNVHTALLERVDEEDGWIARRIASIFAEARTPPTTAVLLRRRADMAGVAAALRDAGLPVEVVGLGGLIDEPEVADIIAMLRVIVDHDAGPAAVRLLTGARWRLGLADLDALARRARRLSAVGPVADGLAETVAAAAAGQDSDSAGLVDAVLDPGAASGQLPNEREDGGLSVEGHRRVLALAREIRYLRSRLGTPLADLVADVERVMGLDVEVLIQPRGRVHLDAFARVVDEIAATGAGVIGLLDYLTAAAEREDGLPPGLIEPAPGRVQVLTVHAAKGLEWDVVALPHLCDGVFPVNRTTTWLGEAGRLPPGVRGDRDDLPELNLPTDGDQSAMVKALAHHVSELKAVQLAEERRLAYVGLTRARLTLLLSAHHWGATGSRPRGPGVFFSELLALPASGEPEVLAPVPGDLTVNPVSSAPRTAAWPVDPLGDRRAAVAAGADAVRGYVENAVRGSVPRGAVGDSGEVCAGPSTDGASARGNAGDPHGWREDVDALLADRAAHARVTNAFTMPDALSVSSLVELESDPDRLARRLRRPMPEAPTPQARRGTAFHAWVEREFNGGALVEIDDLPGADDRDAPPDERLPELIAAFRRSEWASRMPIAVEVPFSTVLGGIVVRGRIDAVFSDEDGGVTVVDWKTGPRPPDLAAREAAGMQLEVYRVAWSRWSGLPLDQVRAAFHFVAAEETVRRSRSGDDADLDRRIGESLASLQTEAAGDLQ
jgi:DNA helicase-2/ATP-dependent DNA helicase PcrA